MGVRGLHLHHPAETVTRVVVAVLAAAAAGVVVHLTMNRGLVVLVVSVLLDRGMTVCPG